MMNKKQLINSIFYQRKSFIDKDENDFLVNVDKNIHVGIRFFLKDKSYPNIIFFHGNAELAQEYEDIGNYYNRFNMNLIVADYRGYGLSNGIPDKDNLHSDSKIIFKEVKDYLSKHKYNGKLLIMGRSLGSASACEIISNFEDDIAGCIIESGFATEYSLLSLMNIDPDMIEYNLEDGFMNLAKIKKYKKPLFIIHANLDDIIPFSQAEMIFIESKSTIKDLFKVSGANHNNIIHLSREEYFKKIKFFIESL